MAKWYVAVLLLYLANFSESEEVISELNENFTPHIWGILNYFNTDPNRIYNYNVGVLQNAQKTEKGLFLEIEVQVECRLDPTDTRCGSKIHQCQAYIEKIDGIDRYEILPGASCHPKVEATQKTEYNGESPVQSSSVLQVNEEPTSSVQASNEGDNVNEFVAIRKDSNHCLGCLVDLNTNVEGLPELITTALKHVESERDKKHVLLNILRVQQQVVAGIKFVLVVEVASTVCTKDVLKFTPDMCPLDNSVVPQICQIVYLQKPWISLQKHIIANNCTVSQEFTDVNYPTRLGSNVNYPNDVDNQIDSDNGFDDGVTNFDSVSPIALANIESQIEFKTVPKTEKSTENQNNDAVELKQSSDAPVSENNVQVSSAVDPTNESISTDVLTSPNSDPEIHQIKKRSINSKLSYKNHKSPDKQLLKKLAKYVVEQKLNTEDYEIMEVLFSKEQKSEKHKGVIHSFLINLKKIESGQIEACKTKVLITKNKESKEILKFKCYDGNKSQKKLSRVPREREESEKKLRIRRRTPILAGGSWEVSVSDPDIAKLTQHTLLQLNMHSNEEKKYKVVEVLSASKQVVAGILYKIKAKIIKTSCNKNDVKNSQECVELVNQQPTVCDISIWDRVWLPEGRETTVKCEGHPNEYKFKSSSEPKPPSSSSFRKKRSTSDKKYYKLFKEENHRNLFHSFIQKYNKTYASEHEHKYRFKVFRDNMKIVYLLNKNEQGTGKYGVTLFSDLTQDEFQKYKGLRLDLKSDNDVGFASAEIPDIELPIEFDWRSKEAVTEVKNQGACGSCWAFSVTGNVEGQYKIKHGELLELSEQELVDCDDTDDGCSGGYMSNAYMAIEKLGGLETESDYPYEAEGETCHFQQNLAQVQLSGAVNISSNETKMAQWLVQNGPISIGLNANAMQFYVGGVSHPWKFLCNPNSIDHGVLIVGYGVHKYPYLKKTLPYWIVKNSWGKSWGQQGYYLVYRGDGTCGVNTMASSAIVV